MKNESLGKLEELQTIARKQGFVCMLFHIDDVQDRYDVTNEEALDIMEEAIWYMEGNDMIQSYIDDYCEANEIKEREEL